MSSTLHHKGPAPNDLFGRAQEIKDLISRFELELGLRRLIDFLRDFYPKEENAGRTVSMQYYRLKKDLVAQNVGQDQANIQFNAIGNRILDIVDSALAQVKEAAEPPHASQKGEDVIMLSPEELKALVVQKAQELVQGVTVAPVLTVENLTKTYTRTGFTLHVPQLELQLGQISGLLGENATGKSTLFHILAGELQRSSGKIDFPLFTREGKGLNWFHLKDQISYVPQELPAWKESLLNTLRFEAAMNGLKDKKVEDEVDYVIQRLGLEPHKYKTWKQLSGGYKLRFSLAKALIKGAQLLLLDEPLAHLDLHAQQVLMQDLYHLAKSYLKPLAIFISSQHIHEVEAVADQLFYLDHGKLEVLGTQAVYRGERAENVFEFSCEGSYEQIAQFLQDFPHKKLWTSGFVYLLSTPVEVSGEELRAFLTEKELAVPYFRDISQSVKTRFYATHLE
ncbi:MAG: ATP-binding cassette domain-containing protein [Bacteroidota bacterium]